LLKSISRRATALAFSPDRQLLAVGDDAGQIQVWTVPQGELVAELKSDRATISALAFGRDACRLGGAASPDRGWLLGAGDLAGTLTIFDMELKSVRAYCRGSNYHIHAVAFSPDGMTVASTGRAATRLWDSATGQLLLDLNTGNWMTDVAFSPNGKTLAVSVVKAFRAPGSVTLWTLEPGRGIQTLRGLSAEVEKVVVSPDDRLLAALAQDNKVAVWNIATGQLLHVFEAPPALWVDNAAIAFSLDSRQLAFSGSDETHGRAKLWDVETGKELHSCDFPPGLNNALTFHPDRKLLLFQKELRDPTRLPAGVDPVKNPIVGRVRDLLADPRTPLVEIKEFNQDINWPLASADGRFFVIMGYDGDKRVTGRRIRAFDSTNGDVIWQSARETENLDQAWTLNLDRSGKLLTTANGLTCKVFELPSGESVGAHGFTGLAGGWSPDMPFHYVDNAPGVANGITVVPNGKDVPVVRIGIDGQPNGHRRYFSSTGAQLAWGNVDGTVHVCHFQEVRHRLTTIGLGW
jgi:WD40 repeat protein